MTRAVLAVTLGDPAGIGPELTAKLTARPCAARLLVVGDPRALARDAACAAPPPVVSSPAEMTARGLDVAVLDASPLGALPPHGAVDAEAGRASYAWVVEAGRLALAGDVDAIVTNPIHKEAWHAAGVTVPGHTETLRDLAGVDAVLMLLTGGRLRTALATIHVPLRTVAERLDTGRLLEDLRLLSREIAWRYGVERPRIAVCGLNPHAGEGGLLGTEDDDVIRPAVDRASAEGIDAVGPLPADACIPAAAHGAYDAVFAMYHDQALPTVKALAPRRAINVTLGLPFIRTSVDHGTAFDIAGRGLADPGSLEAAVQAALEMNARRPDQGDG